MIRLLKVATIAAATLLVSNALALDVGSPAPDFSAPSTHGEIVLSQLLEKGPVILAYYYADFTSG